MLIGRHKGGPVWLNNFAGASFFTTWQAPASTPGATQVTNGTQLEAAIAAASPGDTIELTSVGAYTLTASPLWNTAGAALNIVALVEGAYIEGAHNITCSGTGRVLNITGVWFKNTSHYQVYAQYSTINLYRCRFWCTDFNGWSVYCYRPANVLAEGCIWDELPDVGQAAIYCTDSGTANAIVRNCTIDGLIGPSDGLAGYGGATIEVHNTAVRPGAAKEAMYTAVVDSGDYNAATDATMPGANTHDNITWSNYYDASYIPQNANAKTGGDTSNRATWDYYGNVLADFPSAPIGAIYAGE